MGNRTNIGIYIGPGDKDLAAWFNLLEKNHLSRAKWIRGLLAAYSLGEPLRIGIVDRNAPLIQSGDGQGDTVDKSDRFGYGWQIRGPNGEYVIGSVVNVSVSKAEIQPILEEAWANGHKLAPFIKALIRKNLRYAEIEIVPKMDDLNRVWSNYIIKINSQKTETPAARRSKKAASPLPTVTAAKTVESNMQTNDTVSSSVKEKPPVTVYEAPQTRTEPEPKPKPIRNPLLAQI